MREITSAPCKQRACISKLLFITLLCSSWVRISFAQNLSFRTLTIFGWFNGAYPYSSLIQGKDGNFYGTTIFGGTHGCGTLFKIAPDGTLTILHSFAQSDGCGVYGTLLLATDGNFYGTTAYGGTPPEQANGDGTIFRATPDGVITTLYNFCSHALCADGAAPKSGLVEASDGSFYGTTTNGGADCPQWTEGCGTIFRFTQQGMLTTLHRFNGSDGYFPEASLIQASDGMLYGAASDGGDLQCAAPYGCGTIFRISLAGSELTTLHQFTGDDGDQPWSRLTQANDGYLYGTTAAGGQYNWGTIFKIDLNGNLTSLHSFDFTDGGNPFAGLIQATNDGLYGMATASNGNIFQFTLGESLSNIFNFDGGDGAIPEGAILQATTGQFYGTTDGGGDPGCSGCGTIFNLNLGLPPFVALVRNSGKIGQTGGILGQGFTGTTSVTLNGTPAEFIIVSDTYIRATVPSGAASGYVAVTTPGGVLTSNVPFRVIP
jgi:uncharacterized repeat protein (TIGR03803 family)